MKVNLLLKALFFYVFAVWLTPVSCMGQCSDTSKYIMSLAYLRIDPVFDSLLAATFLHKKSKRKRIVTLKLSDKIRFMPFSVFENQIKEELGEKENVALFLNRRKFYEEYYFEPFVCDIFTDSPKNNKANAIIVFSKPIGHYLLAEVLSSKLSLNGDVRNGNSLQLLLVFDNYGQVREVLYSQITY